MIHNSLLYRIIPLLLAAIMALTSSTGLTSEGNRANLEAAWQRFDQEVQIAKAAMQAWQSDPNPQTEAAFNSAAGRVRRLYTLNIKSRDAIEKEENFSVFGAASAGSLITIGGFVMEDIPSAVTWLLGTPDSELYGATWQECEAMFSRLREESRAVRAEIEKLRKNPNDKEQLAKAEARREQLKKNFDSLRIMYRVEQRNLGTMNTFWNERMGPGIQACIDSFNSMDKTDLMSSLLNPDPMTIYNLIKPMVLTEIGRKYVPPLTDPIAQNLSLDILGAGGGNPEWERAMQGLGSKLQGTLAENLAGSMAEEFVKSLPDGMSNTLRKQFHKWLQEKWWDKLPGSADEAYGRYLANFLMESDQRDKIKAQYKKFLVEKSKKQAGKEAAEKLSSTIGDGMLLFSVFQEAATLVMNSEQWRNSMEQAAGLCNSYREEYRKLTSLPAEDGGIDKWEITENDHVTKRWFETKGEPKSKELKEKISIIENHSREARNISAGVKEVQNMSEEQEPPVSYAPFSSYAASLYSGVMAGNIEGEAFAKGHSTMLSLALEYKHSVDKKIDEHLEVELRRNAEKDDPVPVINLIERAKSSARKNHSEYFAFMRQLETLGDALNSFLEERSVYIEKEYQSMISSLSGSPWLPVKEINNYSSRFWKYSREVYTFEAGVTEVDVFAEKQKLYAALNLFRESIRAENHTPGDVLSALNKLSKAAAELKGVMGKTSAKKQAFEGFVYGKIDHWKGILKGSNYELTSLKGSRSFSPSYDDMFGSSRYGLIDLKEKTPEYRTWIWSYHEPYFPKLTGLESRLQEYLDAGMKSIDGTVTFLDMGLGYQSQVAACIAAYSAARAAYDTADINSSSIIGALKKMFKPMDEVYTRLPKMYLNTDPQGRPEFGGNKTVAELVVYLENSYLKAKRTMEADRNKGLQELGPLANPYTIEKLIKCFDEAEQVLEEVDFSVLDKHNYLLADLGEVWERYRQVYNEFIALASALLGKSITAGPQLVLSPPLPDSDPSRVASGLGMARSQYIALAAMKDKLPILKADLKDTMGILLRNKKPAEGGQNSAAYKLLNRLEGTNNTVRSYMESGSYDMVTAYKGNLESGKEEYRKLNMIIPDIQNALNKLAAMLNEAQSKIEAVNNSPAVKQFYAAFKNAYESKDEARVLSMLDDNWSAVDGTLLYDVEDHFRRMFTVFDQIRYEITNLSIAGNGRGAYNVSYDLLIKGTIFENNITHEERSSVVEQLSTDSSGHIRILRTTQGRFWHNN